MPSSESSGASERGELTRCAQNLNLALALDEYAGIDLDF